MTEMEIAAAVVAFLEGNGLDVYQEVECRGGVADIVALNGPGRELWIVEVKKTMSFDLLEQALRRREEAARVFVAAPVSRSAGFDLARRLGLGVIQVEGAKPRAFLRHMAPRVSSDPRHGARLRAALREGHRRSALAGSPSAAGRYTPWRETCEELLRLAEQKPGIPFRAALAEAKHHYRTLAIAIASIRRWLREGDARAASGLERIVPGVQLLLIGGVEYLATVTAPCGKPTTQSFYCGDEKCSRCAGVRWNLARSTSASGVR